MRINKMPRWMAWIMPESFIAITIYPFAMYYRGSFDDVSMDTIEEEEFHWEQQKEMMFIGVLLMLITMFAFVIYDVNAWMYLLLPAYLSFFYLWYIIEWIIKLPIYGRFAYWEISFEREIFFSIGSKRKHYDWIKYVIM